MVGVICMQKEDGAEKASGGWQQREFGEPSPRDPPNPALRSFHLAPSDCCPPTPTGSKRVSSVLPQHPSKGCPREGGVPGKQSLLSPNTIAVIYSFATASPHWVIEIINMRGLISQSN